MRRGIVITAADAQRAEMQRYLADQCTREQLAKAIQDYWASATPVEH